MTYDIELCNEIGYAECSYEYVSSKMKCMKGKQVAVRINSPGGYASDGFKIMQLFRDHGEVTAYLEGLVASAATIISMGCKKVIISPYTQYLIHQSATPVVEMSMMNQDEIRKCISELKKQCSFNETLDNMAAQLYADRCGKKKEEMASVMKKACWMQPEEVVEMGLADEVGEHIGKPTCLDTVLLARLDALNLPIPTVKEENYSESFIQMLASKLRPYFNPAPIVPVTEETIPNITMNKSFNAVLALLSVEAITCADGNAQVTEAQMESINKALEDNAALLDAAKKANDEAIANLRAELDAAKTAAVDAAKAEMQAAIDELNAKLTEKDNEIAQLKELPAGSTHNVKTGNGNSNDGELSAEEQAEVAKALVSRFHNN